MVGDPRDASLTVIPGAVLPPLNADGRRLSMELHSPVRRSDTLRSSFHPGTADHILQTAPEKELIGIHASSAQRAYGLQRKG